MTINSSEPAPEPNRAVDPMEAWLQEEMAEHERRQALARLALEHFGPDDPRVRFALGGIEASQRLLSSYRAALEVSTMLSDQALQSIFGEREADS